MKKLFFDATIVNALGVTRIVIFKNFLKLQTAKDL